MLVGIVSTNDISSHNGIAPFTEIKFFTGERAELCVGESVQPRTDVSVCESGWRNWPGEESKWNSKRTEQYSHCGPIKMPGLAPFSNSETNGGTDNHN